MANPPQQQPRQQPDQQARQAMTAAGLDQQHHDRMMALKPQADAKGFDWLKLVNLVVKYGPGIIADLEGLFGG